MATLEIAPQSPAALTFRDIPLGALYPSPTNPRKHFDMKKLQELADNIESVGLIEPLIVRVNPAENDRHSYEYEVIAGGRRLRALQLLKMQSVPCVIRELTDEEVRELQISENLQREDVHPLEEGEGYRELLELKHGFSGGASEKSRVHELASKFGKSIAYIYARLKLASLNNLAKEAFRKKLITPGHAILIARLVYHDQIRALAAVFSPYDQSNLKAGLETHVLEENAKVLMQEYEQDPAPVRMSEKDLREWIRDEVNLDLANAPWKLDDASLLPRAGACTDCLMHTKANPDLYRGLGDKAHDYCMNSICFNDKRMALVNIKLGGARVGKDKHVELLQLDSRSRYSAPKADAKIYFQGQWVPAKKGSCPDVQQGVIARGEGMGETKYVCVAAKCKTHTKHWIGGSDSRSTAPKIDYEQERRDREQREKQEDELRGRLVSAILDKVTVLGHRELKLMAASIAESAQLFSCKAFFEKRFKTAAESKLGQQLQSKGPHTTEWARLVMALVLANELHQWDPTPALRKELLAVCRLYQVNADKIIAEFEAEQKPQAIAAKKGGRK